jgi:2-polyprenyl-6-methoxyphenol hydroxylase-like FAD-dependent oxidoreductase
MRAAVIGAGPAGFYACEKLLAAGLEVDLLDALPTPFGLVRSGVAPDHPNIKAVTRVHEETAAMRQAGSDGHLEAGFCPGREEGFAIYACPEEVQRRVARRVWLWSPVARSRMSRAISACTRRRCARGCARPRPTRSAARRRCCPALSVTNSSGVRETQPA